MKIVLKTIRLVNKNDVCLITIVLGVALIIMFSSKWVAKGHTGSEANVVVTIDGEEYARYPLTSDYTEKIGFEDGSYNILSISGGYAKVTGASCPDQICVKHAKISYSGETIVCLPNRLVVTIDGGQDGSVDATTY